jgi:hypothetical protein
MTLFAHLNVSVHANVGGEDLTEVRQKYMEVFACLTEEEKLELDDWVDDTMALYYRSEHSEDDWMTEQDWLNYCFTPNGDNLSDEDLIFAMHIWADWVEENGLGYERGLRMMADYKHGPKFQISGCSSYTWYYTEEDTPRQMLPYDLFIIMFPEGTPTDFRLMYPRGMYFPDALSAVKTLAFAMQDFYKE